MLLGRALERHFDCKFTWYPRIWWHFVLLGEALKRHFDSEFAWYPHDLVAG